MNALLCQQLNMYKLLSNFRYTGRAWSLFDKSSFSVITRIQSWQVDSKSLRTEKQNKFSQNNQYLQWKMNLGPFGIHSDAFLTQLTLQVLIEIYLTSLYLVQQLTLGLK